MQQIAKSMPVRQTRAIGVALVASTLVLSGCSETPKEKYEEAMAKVTEAKNAREEAKSTLSEKKEALADAREEVKEAQESYQEAQRNVDQASSRVDEVVSDELLFRTIQRKLVAKDKFDDSAISVSVNDRVVTLSGTVSSDEVRQQALELAKNKPGVKKVVNSLQTQTSSSEKNTSGQGSSKQGSAAEGGNDGGGG